MYAAGEFPAISGRTLLPNRKTGPQKGLWHGRFGSIGSSRRSPRKGAVLHALRGPARFHECTAWLLGKTRAWRYPRRRRHSGVGQRQLRLPVGDAPETVHSSLWRQSQLNSMQGLYEVIEGIYQVRGFDLSNVTFVEGDTGSLSSTP